MRRKDEDKEKRRSRRQAGKERVERKGKEDREGSVKKEG